MSVAVPLSPERAWRDALEAIATDIDAGRMEGITPNRLPLDLGPLPESLLELAQAVNAKIADAVTVVSEQMSTIDDTLRANAPRGSRRWAAPGTVPSKLDCSA